jgi:hypothetical protein
MAAPADEPEEKPARTLDADDIRFLKTYGLGPYAASIKSTEEDIKAIQKRVVETIGIKESDTGLAPPSRWDHVADKQMLYEEQPLQVCTPAWKLSEGPYNVLPRRTEIFRLRLLCYKTKMPHYLILADFSTCLVTLLAGRCKRAFPCLCSLRLDAMTVELDSTPT